MTANSKDAKMIKTRTKRCYACLPWRPRHLAELGRSLVIWLSGASVALLLLKNNMNSKTRYEIKGTRPTYSIEWIQKDILSTWTSILRPWDYALNTQVDGNCREEQEKVTDVYRERSTAAGVLTQHTEHTAEFCIHTFHWLYCMEISEGAHGSLESI